MDDRKRLILLYKWACKSRTHVPKVEDGTMAPLEQRWHAGWNSAINAFLEVYNNPDKLKAEVDRMVEETRRQLEDDCELTQAQADALDAAMSRPPSEVKTRELPSRRNTC